MINLEGHVFVLNVVEIRDDRSVVVVGIGATETAGYFSSYSATKENPIQMKVFFLEPIIGHLKTINIEDNFCLNHFKNKIMIWGLLC